MTIALISKEKIRKIIWWSPFALAFIGSITMLVIKITQTKKTNVAMIKFNRQLVVSVAAILIVAFIFAVLNYFIKSKVMEILLLIFISLGLATSAMYIFPQVYFFTTEFVYFGEETISTMSLLRATGFCLGILVSFLVGLSASKVYDSLSDKAKNLFIILSILAFSIDYSFRAVSALVRMKILKAEGLIFKIMIIQDNYKKHFIYALLLIGIIFLIIAILQNRKVVGDFKNNALRRKEKAKLRNRRRWAKSLLINSLLVIFILSVVNYIDTKPPDEVPFQSYKEDDKQIFIDVTELEDGHLHKFSYTTPNGFDVAFLAVKKLQGSAYGLGLDACEICGVAGYFERGDDVVCRRCDVVMNKMTIGFKGGCNPIPFPYEVIDGQIVIEKISLEKEEKRFK